MQATGHTVQSLHSALLGYRPRMPVPPLPTLYRWAQLGHAPEYLHEPIDHTLRMFEPESRWDAFDLYSERQAGEISRALLARCLGVTPLTIDNWERRGQVPRDRVKIIREVLQANLTLLKSRRKP